MSAAIYLPPSFPEGGATTTTDTTSIYTTPKNNHCGKTATTAAIPSWPTTNASTTKTHSISTLTETNESSILPKPNFVETAGKLDGASANDLTASPPLVADCSPHSQPLASPGHAEKQSVTYHDLVTTTESSLTFEPQPSQRSPRQLTQLASTLSGFTEDIITTGRGSPLFTLLHFGRTSANASPRTAKTPKTVSEDNENETISVSLNKANYSNGRGNSEPKNLTTELSFEVEGVGQPTTLSFSMSAAMPNSFRGVEGASEAMDVGLPTLPTREDRSSLSATPAITPQAFALPTDHQRYPPPVSTTSARRTGNNNNNNKNNSINLSNNYFSGVLMSTDEHTNNSSSIAGSDNEEYDDDDDGGDAQLQPARPRSSAYESALTPGSFSITGAGDRPTLMGVSSLDGDDGPSSTSQVRYERGRRSTNVPQSATNLASANASLSSQQAVPATSNNTSLGGRAGPLGRMQFGSNGSFSTSNGGDDEGDDNASDAFSVPKEGQVEAATAVGITILLNNNDAGQVEGDGQPLTESISGLMDSVEPLLFFRAHSGISSPQGTSVTSSFAGAAGRIKQLQRDLSSSKGHLDGDDAHPVFSSGGEDSATTTNSNNAFRRRVPAVGIFEPINVTTSSLATSAASSPHGRVTKRHSLSSVPQIITFGGHNPKIQFVKAQLNNLLSSGDGDDDVFTVEDNPTIVEVMQRTRTDYTIGQVHSKGLEPINKSGDPVVGSYFSNSNSTKGGIRRTSAAKAGPNKDVGASFLNKSLPHNLMRNNVFPGSLTGSPRLPSSSISQASSSPPAKSASGVPPSRLEPLMTHRSDDKAKYFPSNGSVAKSFSTAFGTSPPPHVAVQSIKGHNRNPSDAPSSSQPTSESVQSLNVHKIPTPPSSGSVPLSGTTPPSLIGLLGPNQPASLKPKSSHLAPLFPTPTASGAKQATALSRAARFSIVTDTEAGSSPPPSPRDTIAPPLPPVQEQLDTAHHVGRRASVPSVTALLEDVYDGVGLPDLANFEPAHEHGEGQEHCTFGSEGGATARPEVVTSTTTTETSKTTPLATTTTATAVAPIPISADPLHSASGNSLLHPYDYGIGSPGECSFSYPTAASISQLRGLSDLGINYASRFQGQLPHPTPLNIHHLENPTASGGTTRRPNGNNNALSKAMRTSSLKPGSSYMGSSEELALYNDVPCDGNKNNNSTSTNIGLIGGSGGVIGSVLASTPSAVQPRSSGGAGYFADFDCFGSVNSGSNLGRCRSRANGEFFSGNGSTAGSSMASISAVLGRGGSVMSCANFEVLSPTEFDIPQNKDAKDGQKTPTYFDTAAATALSVTSTPQKLRVRPPLLSPDLSLTSLMTKPPLPASPYSGSKGYANYVAAVGATHPPPSSAQAIGVYLGPSVGSSTAPRTVSPCLQVHTVPAPLHRASIVSSIKGGRGGDPLHDDSSPSSPTTPQSSPLNAPAAGSPFSPKTAASNRNSFTSPTNCGKHASAFPKSRGSLNNIMTLEDEGMDALKGSNKDTNAGNTAPLSGPSPANEGLDEAEEDTIDTTQDQIIRVFSFADHRSRSRRGSYSLFASPLMPKTEVEGEGYEHQPMSATERPPDQPTTSAKALMAPIDEDDVVFTNPANQVVAPLVGLAAHGKAQNYALIRPDNGEESFTLHFAPDSPTAAAAFELPPPPPISLGPVSHSTTTASSSSAAQKLASLLT